MERWRNSLSQGEGKLWIGRLTGSELCGDGKRVYFFCGSEGQEWQCCSVGRMAVVRCDTLSSVSLHLCGDSKHSWHLAQDANSWKCGAFVPNVCFYLDGMFDLNTKWQGGIATTFTTAFTNRRRKHGLSIFFSCNGSFLLRCTFWAL